MLPIRYYRELLSNCPEDYAVYVNSPFPKQNRVILTASDVSSRYTRRNRHEFGKIADYIEAIAEGNRGITWYFSLPTSIWKKWRRF